MRIEITAGGISSAIATFSFKMSLDEGIDCAEKVLASFKTVQNAILNIKGQDPTTVSAADYIADRIQTDSDRKERMVQLKENYVTFMENTKNTDKRVALLVDQNKEAFYQVNPWLRPPKEHWYQKWYEDAKGFLNEVIDKTVQKIEEIWERSVEFYQKNQKWIHSIVVVFEAVAITVLSIFTFGSATILIPILVGVVNAASAVMDLMETWGDSPFIDSPGFKAIKFGVDTLALVSKIVVLSGAAGLALPGIWGELFEVSAGASVVWDISKSVGFFIVDGFSLTYNRNFKGIDLLKDIDDLDSFVDNMENVEKVFKCF